METTACQVFARPAPPACQAMETTACPSTPPPRSSPRHDGASPAKRRKLRAAATSRRLWGRSRWQNLAAEEDSFLSKDSEIAALRQVIASLQQEVFGKESSANVATQTEPIPGLGEEASTQTTGVFFSTDEVEHYMENQVEALVDAKLANLRGTTGRDQPLVPDASSDALLFQGTPCFDQPLAAGAPTPAAPLRDSSMDVVPAPVVGVLEQPLVSAASSCAEPVKAEVDVQKTSEAELPFLQGIEVLAATVATTAISNCEAAASTAQKGITDARNFVVQMLAEAKQFSDAPAESCTKMQMQASGEKIAGVEAAVQGLAATLAKLSDAKLAEISAEDARSVCEEIAQAEHGTQAAVADARKFLAQRLQDAKGFSETVRGPITKDLSKLQSRLTQCQVELAKLSKQRTEREVTIDTMALLTEAMGDPTALPPPAANIASELLQSEPERYSTCVLCGGLGLNPYTVNVEEAGESEHEELYGCEAECGTCAHVGCIEAGGPIKPKRHTRFKRYRSGWVEQGPGIFCPSCW